MKRLTTLIFGLALSAAAAAQPLLSPTELQSRLADPQVRVIDIRDPKSYAAKHISGAINAPYGSWRGAATKEELLQRIKSGDSVLIDARPAEFFQGDTRHPVAKLPGTLKGAVNLEHDKWFAPGSSTFMSTAQAKQVAAASLIDPEKETVSFCNTGHWAATNWFAMSEVLGQKNVKLYAGSMVDWSQDANGLPMDNVPSRAKQLLIDAKLWIARIFK